MYCKVKKNKLELIILFVRKVYLVAVVHNSFCIMQFMGKHLPSHTSNRIFSVLCMVFFFSRPILHRNTCDRRSSVFLPPPPPLFFSIFFVPLVIHKHKHTSCFMF
ncbi:hypothetical protein MG5_05397 [Candida albicans P57072]|nr:hypothetical protein MG5_05397 [Candida albicans P57072]KGU01905.1 hypothetical protein MEQ_05371 [Candida albicans P87]KHC29867.1 putative protein of unknown function, transcription is upregulated in clinical isolates from HIV patients with oral candidiasis [Candida albicans P76067]